MITKLSLLALFVLGGCKSIGGCDNKTQTLEAEYASPTYDFILQTVDALKRQGYNCQSIAIRNGFGTAIGDRYTCTKC